MFVTQKNESMKNLITYATPKNNVMAHSMSLNNRILCILGISIFGFKKYQQRVFNLMELNIIPTFKHFLPDETDNSEKNKSCCQQCNVKIMGNFHKQAMAKQQTYENRLLRQSGMDYSAGIHFQTSLVNMDKAKALTRKINRENKSEASKTVPVWLHQALTNNLKWFPCGDFLS